jgi:hypothetical protein
LPPRHAFGTFRRIADDFRRNSMQAGRNVD